MSEWNELVEECTHGTCRRINVGSRKRRDVIVDTDNRLQGMGRALRDILAAIARGAGVGTVRDIAMQALMHHNVQVLASHLIDQGETGDE